MDRRQFLKVGAAGAGAAVLGVRFLGGAITRAFAAVGPYGALQAADANGIRLPAGFTSRVVATSGQRVPGTSYVWHDHPDGGACFAAGSDWIYVSNSEKPAGTGGVGALRFNSSGSVTDAYRILSGTSRNCAGGATPWGTWLSCEESTTGRVWECDPTGANAAVVHPAMGSFNHEAAACDPVRQHVYLTEDTSTGKLRRFRPTVWGDLSAGILEVAALSGSNVTWTTTASNGTAFNGGEGAWYADGKVWFTTKGDNRVWELDVSATPNTIRVIYDDSTSPSPVLTGVDNIVGSASGDLFVAEDGGNMELVVIEPSGAVSVFMRVTQQGGSEITGPAFSPDGSRLYFSSQRGPTGSGVGVTYEVTGPFRSSSTPPSTTTTTSSGGTIMLTAIGRTEGGRHVVDLTWSGATTPEVKVRRNGDLIARTANDGAYTDDLGTRKGTFRYKVVEPRGDASNVASVTF